MGAVVEERDLPVSNLAIIDGSERQREVCYKEVVPGTRDDVPHDVFHETACLLEPTGHEINHFFSCLWKIRSQLVTIQTKSATLLSLSEFEDFLVNCIEIWKDDPEMKVSLKRRHEADKRETNVFLAPEWCPDIFLTWLRQSGIPNASKVACFGEFKAVQRSEKRPVQAQSFRGQRILFRHQPLTYALLTFVWDRNQVYLIFTDHSGSMISVPLLLLQEKYEDVGLWCAFLKTVCLGNNKRYGPQKELRGYQEPNWQVQPLNFKNLHGQWAFTIKYKSTADSTPQSALYRTIGEEDILVDRDHLHGPYSFVWPLVLDDGTLKRAMESKVNDHTDYTDEDEAAFIQAASQEVLDQALLNVTAGPPSLVVLKCVFIEMLRLPVLTYLFNGFLKHELDVYSLQKTHDLLSTPGFVAMAEENRTHRLPAEGVPLQSWRDWDIVEPDRSTRCGAINRSKALKGPGNCSARLNAGEDRLNCKSDLVEYSFRTARKRRIAKVAVESSQGRKKPRTMQATSAEEQFKSHRVRLPIYLLMKHRMTLLNLMEYSIVDAKTETARDQGLWMAVRCNLGAQISFLENSMLLGIDHADYSFSNVYFLRTDELEPKRWFLRGTLGDWGNFNVARGPNEQPFRQSGTAPFLCVSLGFYICNPEERKKWGPFERHMIHEIESNFLGLVYIFAVYLKSCPEFEETDTAWEAALSAPFKDRGTFRSVREILTRGWQAFKDSIFREDSPSRALAARYLEMLLEMYHLLFERAFDQVGPWEPTTHFVKQFDAWRHSHQNELAAAYIQIYDKYLKEQNQGCQQIMQCIRHDEEMRKAKGERYVTAKNTTVEFLKNIRAFDLHTL